MRLLYWICSVFPKTFGGVLAGFADIPVTVIFLTGQRNFLLAVLLPLWKKTAIFTLLQCLTAAKLKTVNILSVPEYFFQDF